MPRIYFKHKLKGSEVRHGTESSSLSCLLTSILKRSISLIEIKCHKIALLTVKPFPVQREKTWGAFKGHIPLDFLNRVKTSMSLIKTILKVQKSMKEGLKSTLLIWIEQKL
jgi:hypothetical protein